MNYLLSRLIVSLLSRLTTFFGGLIPEGTDPMSFLLLKLLEVGLVVGYLLFDCDYVDPPFSYPELNR